MIQLSFQVSDDKVLSILKNKNSLSVPTSEDMSSLTPESSPEYVQPLEMKLNLFVLTNKFPLTL